MARKLHTIPVSTAALLAAILASAPITAQSPPRQKIDVSKLGPQVGDRVPDFSLKDQNGKDWTLKSIMGPGDRTARRSWSSCKAR
jgi:hypothetical protein